MGNVPSQQNSNQSNRTNINQASSSSSYSSPSSSPSSPSTLPSSNISNNHQYSNNLLPKISTSHPINNNQSNQPLIQSSSLPTPSPSSLLSSNINQSRIPSHVQISTSSIDSGYLYPLSNIYPSSHQDYNHSIVQRLILSRKLAPFYRGLEDWSIDLTSAQLNEALLSLTSHRQESVRSIRSTIQSELNPLQSSSPSYSSSSSSTSQPSVSVHPHTSLTRRIGKSLIDRHHSSSSSSSTIQSPLSPSSSQNLNSRTLNLSPRFQVFEAVLLSHVRPAEASRYLNETVECPICFLYYPSNINYSRCCQQPICTECFVQIKRADPTPQELKSEPACCPYCVESNFGVTYEPPPPDQRTGWTFPVSQSPLDSSPSPTPPVTSPGTESDDKRLSKRRQTTSHTSQEVVTTDSIQEDWQIKLESVKAAVQRRANRRIIFRQDGDRLVPIGITSSGGGDVDGSSRRRRNHRNQSDPQQQRHYGLELEELMVMEAMRLSLVDEEERKRKEKDEEESLKKIKLAISDATTSGTDQASTSKSAVEGGLRDDETGGLRGKAEGVRSMGHPDSGVCKLEQLKLDTVSSDKQQQQQQSSSSSLLAPLSLSPVEVGAGGLVSSLLEQADSDVVDVGSGTEDQTDINLSQ